MKRILLMVILCVMMSSPNAKYDTNKALNQKLLETSIKCKSNSFSFNGYYYYPDYGCIYDKTNPIGDTQVYLFPITKKFLPTLDDSVAVTNMETHVNKLVLSDIKANFDIFIRVIDKKYLVYRKNIDTPYYISDNHVSKIYHFNRDKHYWEIIKTNEDIDEDPNKFYRIFKKK